MNSKKLAIVVIVSLFISGCAETHFISNSYKPSSNGSDSSSQAPSFSTDKLTFTLNEDKETYSVSAASQYIEGEIKIPATYQYKAVTTVKEAGFKGCSYITAVYLPDSIITVENEAFYMCSGLTLIDFGRSVKYIGDSVIVASGKLKNVRIPDTLERIGDNSFSANNTLTFTEYDNGLYLGNTRNPYVVLAKVKDSSNITSCTINPNCRCIGSHAFSVTEKIKNIEIPNSVVSIGSYCFYYTRFEKITINEGVKYFEDCCFAYTRQTSFYIPDSLEYIGDGVFYLDNITSFVVNSTNQHFVVKDGILYTKDGTSLIACTTAKSGQLTIPNGVIEIKGYAFSQCTSLTEISMPSSLKRVNLYAFDSCTKLTNLTFSSLEVVGDCAFVGCENLEILDLGENIKTIGNRILESSNKITNIYLGPNVESIDENAFSNVPNNVFNGYYNARYLGTKTNPYCALIKVYYNTSTQIVHDDCVFIAKKAYQNEKSMTEIRFGPNIKIIDDYAFSGSALSTITIPDSVTKIGIGVFSSCSNLKEATIGNKITTIPDDAFNYCQKLSQVTFNGKETSIGERAFRSDTSLVTINLPNTVTSIGQYAFSGSGLQNITIPKDMATINKYVFYSCAKLSYVVLPASIKLVEESAFQSCPNLYRIYSLARLETESTIEIKDGNDGFNAALFLYYSETRPDDDDPNAYWKYVDGEPTSWTLIK